MRLLIVYPPQVQESKDVATGGQRSRLALIALCGALYFSEGLPFGLVNELSPIYLRQRGASLAAVGFLSTISLLWTLKFLWSPLIDRYGSYRDWIRAALFGIVLSLLPLALLGNPPLQLVWIVLALLALASATQDIAIDAFTIVVSPSRDLGHVNATRIAAYRAAIIFSGGALAAVSSYRGWQTSFALAAILASILFFFSFTLPRGGRAGTASGVVESLRRWLRHPQLFPIVGIAVLYRLGDAALAPMIKPFWLDRGHSAAEIGTVTTVIGVAFTIAGSIVGGIIIARYGIIASLFWLGLAQMLSNGGYALLAAQHIGRGGWYAAAINENFTGGLGAAAFLSFLMSTAAREHAATDFALLTALYRLSSSLAGTASGFLTQRLGYERYFVLTLILGIPALIMVYLWRDRIASASADAAGGSVPAP